MPVIILCGCLAIFGAVSAAENSRSQTPPADADEMLRQMIGKPRSECRKIARRYGGR